MPPWKPTFWAMFFWSDGKRMVLGCTPLRLDLNKIHSLSSSLGFQPPGVYIFIFLPTGPRACWDPHPSSSSSFFFKAFNKVVKGFMRFLLA